MSFAHLVKLAHDLAKAIVTAHHLENIVEQENLRGRLIIYSYWLNNNALGASLVSIPNCDLQVIARGHGVDIYESRNVLTYLSYRNTLARTLNKIYCISQNGSEHLRTKTNPEFHGKISVSRLGTLYAGEPAQKIDREIFHVVSCSFLLPVKQVHLIIEALAMIETRNVTWTHIGDGEQRPMLEALAKQKLAGNITYSFKGSIQNAELMQFYRDHYVHLFVNASASEGIPVTMMEAQSFGIPIVAPAVGGIEEIVSPENGILIPAGSSAKEVAVAISTILQMNPTSYQELRANAFRSWDSKYNAEKNFPTFVSEILSL